MSKFIERHKIKIVLILIVLSALLIEDAVHKYMRANNYWKASYEDSIKPGSTIKTYDESSLTKEEFNELFYGESKEEDK